MSASQDWIDARLPDLQRAIDDRDVGDDLFELKDLVLKDEWNALGSLRRSVTEPFKKRIVGYNFAEGAVLTNIQVRKVKLSGRERMFQRIDGINNPGREDEAMDGEI